VSRRSLIALAGLVALSLAALLFSPAPALAGTASDRPLLFSFDGSDTTAGQFGTLSALEIDQANGLVYVIDVGHDVLDKFNLAGTAQNFSATGSSSLSPEFPGDTFNGESDVTVDNSGVNPGRIHVMRENGPLEAFSPAGASLWEIGGLADVCGLAVDTAGHPWVGDYTNGKATEYAASGSPPAEIGSVAVTSGNPCRLEVDASGNLYINRWRAGVDKYEGGVKVATLDTTESHGVTVDQSSATGHVFTIHSGDFNEYESSGTLVGTFGAGSIGDGQGIAYDKALDRVYVSDRGSNTVKVFGPAVTGTVPDVTIEASTEVGISKAKFNGKVNPQSVPNSYFFEWKQGTGASWSGAKSSAPQNLPEDSSDHAVSFNATGLAGNTTYQVRLVGTNTENGLKAVSSADTFTTATAASAPEMTISAPSGVTTTAAEVSGTVNPKEDFTATWRLQLSTDPGCASGFSDQPNHNLESEANSPVAVAEELTGLLPNQHYCVRIAATNSAGTATSETKEFTTEPIPPDQVFTAFAAPRTDTSARLNGRVNPEGANPVYPLTYRFEFSEDGGATWISLGDHEYSGGAREQIVLAEELTELSPDTTYQYRFSAENAAGSASPQGGVETFTTRTTAEMNPPARGFELVNNPDKGNQRVLELSLPRRETPRMSADGEKVLWSVTGGAPGGGSGAGAVFLAKRTESGWKSASLLPPAEEQIGGGDSRYYLDAVSPDFSKFIFTTGPSQVVSQFLDEPVAVRLDDSQHQEVLRRFEDHEYCLCGNVDVTEHGDHVLVEDPTSEQIEDIGSGTREPVSVMPDGSPVECFGGTQQNGIRLEQWKPDYHIMSASDASRVYFLAKPNDNCGSGLYGLYVRDRESGETTLIDPGAFGQEPKLIRATASGRAAYFITRSQLDPADANAGRDIYRWDEESGESTCLTCAFSSDAKVGAYAMVSDDFSHVYFESTAQLVPGQGAAGDTNLYVLNGGALRFVADPDQIQIGYPVLFSENTSLSRDGDVLLFETAASRRLTADEVGPVCTGISSGKEITPSPCTELYRYDDRNSSLECVSCRRGGATTYAVGAEPSVGRITDSLSGDGEARLRGGRALPA